MNKCIINENNLFDADSDKCLECDYYKDCLDTYERYYLE